jgi:hypothetical protein
MSLYAANQQLQEDVKTAQQRSEQARELNRRLCRETNDARSVRSSALEEVELLKKQVAQFQKEAKKARSENASLHEALQASRQELLELAEAKVDVIDNTCVFGLDTISLEQLQIDEEIHPGNAVCSCNTDRPWGCSLHRVYSDGLLLAHRELASRVSRGPPGLELEAPPGLEVSLAAASNRGLHLVPAF